MNGLPHVARRLRDAGRQFATLAEDAATLARLTRDLRLFLRDPVTLAVAGERLADRLAHREQRFLTVVEQAIYSNNTSPYLRLLRHVGCDLGDFRALVASEGIEGALKRLADQGVYVTFEEQKGRREIVRGSLRFACRESDLDNPTVRPHLILSTGGSTGRPGRVRFSLAAIDEWAASIALVYEAHGVFGVPEAYWWPVAIQWMLTSARVGQPVAGWFYPVHPLPAVVRLVAAYLALAARLAGGRFLTPQRADLAAPATMLAWVAAHLRRRGPLLLRTMPSAAARLSMAATAAGQRLDGLTVVAGGEPVTATRRQQIEASGARVIVLYASTELNGLSYSCAAPTSSDDVHVMTDRYALVQQPRAVLPTGETLRTLLFTSLYPTAGKIAFNLEIGDTATVEERDCGCLLGQRGLRLHLSQIHSYEKLTGEGVTFARSNLQQILDEVLPSQFGGTSLDYQLAEEETVDGSTQLILRVSPSVGAVDDAKIRDVLLAELGRDSLGAEYQAAIWREADTVQVRREPPRATQAGKVLPFQFLMPSDRPTRGTRQASEDDPSGHEPPEGAER